MNPFFFCEENTSFTHRKTERVGRRVNKIRTRTEAQKGTQIKIGDRNGSRHGGPILADVWRANSYWNQPQTRLLYL